MASGTDEQKDILEKAEISKDTEHLNSVTEGVRRRKARPIAIVILIGMFLTVIMGYAASTYVSGIQLHRLISVILLPIFSSAAVAFLTRLRDPESQGDLRFKSSPTEDTFMRWSMGIFVAAILIFLSILMALVALDTDPGIMTTTIEIGVLALTIVFIVLCSKFTAKSFAMDVNELVLEFRSSNESLAQSYRESSHELVDTFDDNTTRLIDKLDEQGEKQAVILSNLASAVREVGEVLKKQESLAEETRRISEETLQLQKEAEEERKRLEDVKKAIQLKRDESERLRIMPRLAFQMYSSGTIFHHLKIEIFNGGMTGENLEVTIYPGSDPLLHRKFGSIGGHEHKYWDIGDVGDYDLRVQFRVSLIAADSKGRRYMFEGSIAYVRTLGFFKTTKSIDFKPRRLIWPKGQLIEEETSEQ